MTVSKIHKVGSPQNTKHTNTREIALSALRLSFSRLASLLAPRATAKMNTTFIISQRLHTIGKNITKNNTPRAIYVTKKTLQMLDSEFDDLDNKTRKVAYQRLCSILVYLAVRNYPQVVHHINTLQKVMDA